MTLTFAKNDFGLGTAYERVAVYRLFDKWLAPRSIASAFEGPIDGMAGIPGVHLIGAARRGTPVTVGLTNEAALDNVRSIYATLGVDRHLTTRVFGEDEALPKAAWDLALTYNAFPLVADWRALLTRVAAASKRWVLVAVTNPFSYGVVIRKTLRLVEPSRKEELFDHPSTQPAIIEGELAKFGRVVEHAFFDCPWWPDLFVDAGESLFGATLKRMPIVGRKLVKKNTTSVQTENAYAYGAGNFPLFDDRGPLAKALARHPVFDRAPSPAPRMFGHLHAYLVDKS